MPYSDKYATLPDGYPPMDVIRARHQSVLRRRCVCGAKKDPREVTNGIRRWLSCDRCLGPIKQLPDKR